MTEGQAWRQRDTRRVKCRFKVKPVPLRTTARSVPECSSCASPAHSPFWVYLFCTRLHITHLQEARINYQKKKKNVKWKRERWVQNSNTETKSKPESFLPWHRQSKDGEIRLAVSNDPRMCVPGGRSLQPHHVFWQKTSTSATVGERIDK